MYWNRHWSKRRIIFFCLPLFLFVWQYHFALAGVLSIDPPSLKEPKREISSSKEALSEYTKLVAAKYDIPPLLLTAIAQGESRWNIWAVTIDEKRFLPKDKEEALEILNSSEGKPYRLGIMQVSDRWLQKFGISDFDGLEPNVNIHLAAYILNEYFVAYGPKWQVIAAYHAEDASSPQAVAYAKQVWASYRRLIEEEQNKEAR